MAAVKADVVLQQLNSEFEKSKSEQIYRFLRDQEEMNNQVEMPACDLSDLSDDSTGNSDTETLLAQRLDLYRVRPQSAKFWHIEDANDLDLVCVGKNAISENMPTNQPPKGPSRRNVVYRSTRDRNRRKHEAPPIPPTSPEEDSPPMTRKPSFRHRKLRAAKPPTTENSTSRPRTATGARRPKLSEADLSLNLKEENPIGDISGQRLRNSAPASLSRPHQKSMMIDEDRSYLRVGDSGQLLTPRNLSTQSSSQKLGDIFSSPKKLPTYSSSRNTETQLSQTFELPSQLSKRKTSESRKEKKFVSSLKLPPLETSGALNTNRDTNNDLLSRT